MVLIFLTPGGYGLDPRRPLFSLVYWIVSFAQREQERHEFTPQMQNFLLAMTGATRSARVALANSGIGTTHKSGKP